MQWFNRGINEEGRLLAEDCLLAQPIGGLLWRKPTLKFLKSVLMLLAWDRHVPGGDIFKDKRLARSDKCFR